MAEKNTAPDTATQKETVSTVDTGAVIARRLAAVQAAGNLSPKMQRGFDRLAATNIN